MMYLTRWFSSYRLPRNINTQLRIGWVAALVVTVFMGLDMASRHTERYKDVTEEVYENAQDEITISFMEADFAKKAILKNSRVFGLERVKNGYVHYDDHVLIKRADNGKLRVETIKSAQGRNLAQAERGALAIDGKHRFEKNNTLLLTRKFLAKKYQSQNLAYVVYIPEGTKVKFGKRLARRIDLRSEFQEGCLCDESKYTWEMTDKGLYSQEWYAANKAPKRITFPSEHKSFNIDARMNIEVVYGEKPSMIYYGRQSDLDKMDIVHTKGVTTLIRDDRYSRAPKLVLTLPSLDVLDVKNAQSLTIKGFEQDAMTINYEGRKDVDVYVDVKNLTCNLKGSHEFNLIGSGEVLNILAPSARINADRYKAESRNITRR